MPQVQMFGRRTYIVELTEMEYATLGRTATQPVRGGPAGGIMTRQEIVACELNKIISEDLADRIPPAEDVENEEES